MKKDSKILLITLEPVAEKMAGPAIRALELAKILARKFEAAVFSPVSQTRVPDLDLGQVKLYTGGGTKELNKLLEYYNVLFIQANVLKAFPHLAEAGKYLIVDLYDPYLFPVLVQYEKDDVQADASYRLMHQILEKHMLEADFTVCASERQRDYWLGRFCALGRIDPRMYHFDKSLRKLIDVVPYGLPADTPLKNGPGLRERITEIGADDPVLLWGGGIWDWFDPLTVIKATKEASKTIPNLRLVFMGTKSPNPKVVEMDMTGQARQLAEELGLTNKNVFFLEGWVDYKERLNYLLDATIAVSAHFDLPETSFSFRTRILDYFYAGLPILTTRGDQLADLIESHQAGRALDYQDVDGWTRAILEFSRNKEKCQSAGTGARSLADNFTWEKNAVPLEKFLENPYHLPRAKKITMPSLVERARAVYRRGGSELILARSKELLKDILK